MVKNILIVLFVLFTGYSCYDYGYKTAYTKQSNKYIQQLTEQETKYKELQKNYNLIQLDKENEIKIINTKYTAIINSLRNRPERVNQTQTSSTPAISSRAGSTGEQLFREDAEFLIGEASKAETLKQSLTSCRRYLLEINK